MRRVLSTLIGVLALLTTTVGSPVASYAAEELPVNYNFLGGAVAGGMQLNSHAPGTNDWACKPTKRHPRPVVLVHGTLGNRSTNWQAYGPLLKNHGYCVFALTYGVAAKIPGVDLFGGLADIRGSAEELAGFVDKVLRRTGAKKVDIIGHSQGTYMPQYWVKFLGGRKLVRNYISLAPLWKGTKATDLLTAAAGIFGAEGSLPVCTSCPQMGSSSAFLKRLRKGGLAIEGIRYTNIMSRYDELVIPWHSGREPGMKNIVLQDVCRTDYTEHFEIAADPVGAHLALNRLDPKHPVKVPCPVVLPFIGPVSPLS